MFDNFIRKIKVEKELVDIFTSYEVRKTGGDEYSIVALNKRGHSENLYSKGRLLTFDTSEEAKSYVSKITQLSQRSN